MAAPPEQTPTGPGRTAETATRSSFEPFAADPFASDPFDGRPVHQRSARELAEHLRLALAAGGLGTWRWNRLTGDVSWDPAMEALYGLEPGTFPGTFDAWVALLHPDDISTARGAVEAAVATRGVYDLQHRVVWPDGSVRWLQGRGQMTVNEDGQVTGAIGCTLDVTDRTLVDHERAQLMREALDAAERERAHRERLEFLGRINDALAHDLDHREIMRNVTAAAVPRLGDWCAINVLPVGPVGAQPEVEIAHADPDKVAFARELHARFPYDPDAPNGIAAVIRTGVTEFYPEISPEVLDQAGRTEAARQVARDLALRSAIIVPLMNGGRVLGGMQFVMAESDRHYTADDVALAEAVGGRIAAALENARLHEQQRTIARTLQASLLPATLPPVPGAEVAVRYWAAGEGTEVGGDFYDVFPLPDDAWGLVIGDVCGTGPSAASLTGLARHTIRAAARHDNAPTEVLRWLNDAVHDQGSELFCTAVFATLRPADDPARPNELVLSAAAGGHPLPIVVAADGSARTIGKSGSLLGAYRSIRLTTHEEPLRSGDVLVLYTDGVTDVSPPHGLTADEMEQLVARAVRGAESAEDTADALGEAIAAILPIHARQDDIAILVVRIT